MAIFYSALSLYPADEAWKKIATGGFPNPAIRARLEELRQAARLPNP